MQRRAGTWACSRGGLFIGGGGRLPGRTYPALTAGPRKRILKVQALLARRAGLTQLVECYPYKVEVPGSSPGSRTNEKPLRKRVSEGANFLMDALVAR